MTAFSTSNLPASIDTLEKLAVWVGYALHNINPDQTAIEGDGSPVKVAQFGVFKIEQTNKTNIFLRQSIELEEGFVYHDGPIWEKVVPFSNESLPSQLTA